MTGPLLLEASSLRDEERDLLAALRNDVMANRPRLELRDAYYNGTQIIQDMGISIPPNLRKLNTVVGWPRVSVDSVDERLTFQGFRYSNDPAGDSYLDSVLRYNNSYEESHLAHLDALIFGYSFATVSTNPDDETMPLVSMESPLDMTCLYDARTRTISAAVRLYQDEDGRDAATLLLPDSTIHVKPREGYTGWDVADRDSHGMGMCPVTRIGNRRRVNDRRGSSEISPEVMSITDATCRTLLGLEVAREFYGAPQKYILGASESAFQDAEGNTKSAWETYLGRVLALERDEEGEIPQVGQFAAYDPGTYTKIVEMYGKLMVSQTGIPPQNFGLTYENPASAEAIRMSEQRLVNRVERRQVAYGADWEHLAKLIILNATATLPPEGTQIAAMWRDAATPTLAAQADAATKLVQAGILPPDSDITLELCGFSPSQRLRIAEDRRRAGAQAARQALIAGAATQGAPEQTEPEETVA